MRIPFDKDPTVLRRIESYQQGKLFNLLAGLSQPVVNNNTDGLDFSLDPSEFYVDLFLAERLESIEDMINPNFKPKLGKGRDVLHVGFDTEYYFDESLQRNVVLSYQVALVAFCSKTHQLRQVTNVIYPKSGEVADRLSLETLISQVIQLALTQKLITEWCCYVYLYAHFLRADFSSLSSLFNHKKTLRGLSNTLSGHAEIYGNDEHDIGGKLFKPQLIKLSDKSRHTRYSIVHFVDTLLLTPNKSGLKKVGDLLGIPKLDIPAPYSIERMGEFLENAPEAFEAYGLRDAELAVYYGLFMHAWTKVELGLKRLPMTLAGCGLALFKSKINRDRLHEFFGIKVNTHKSWNASKNAPVVRNATELTTARLMYEDFTKKCYHGGRNETYVVGVTPEDFWEDMDLKSAYSVAQLGILQPDWNNVYTSKNVADFKVNVLGFAHISFKFPENVKYPSLPVDIGSYGLIYPLEGMCHVTAPEIQVALNLGCHITIHQGVILPFVAGSTPIFLDFVKFIRENRQKHQSGSLMELLIKEVGNSLYGKTAQGLKIKNTFDIDSGRSKPLPLSAISNPYIAAYTSGLVRAILSEQIAGLFHHNVITHLTTDGFCSNIPERRLNIINGLGGKPASEHFRSLFSLVSDGDESRYILGLKHQVKQLIVAKTRAQYTTIADGNSIILAKGGVKPNCEKPLENDYMLDLYLNRQPHQEVINEQFISMREQWLGDRDLIRISRSRKLNMEFDCKRKPVNPVMQSFEYNSQPMEHIYLDTVPFKTVDDFMTYRSYFDGWRKGRLVVNPNTGANIMVDGHCLKTLEDWDSWEDYRACAIYLKETKRFKLNGVKTTQALLLRLFITAYAHKQWGLQGTLSYAQVTNVLTNDGYDVSVDDFKNAGRKKYAVRPVLPLTKGVSQLLSVLLKHFPELNLSDVLSNEDIQTFTNPLN